MTFKNKILLFSINILIGFAIASFSYAGTCDTDNGAGVGCADPNNPYYCDGSCRSMPIGFCPTFSDTLPTNCAALDGCGACGSCSAGWQKCGLYPNTTCTLQKFPNCNTMDCATSKCSSCATNYVICNLTTNNGTCVGNSSNHCATFSDTCTTDATAGHCASCVSGYSRCTTAGHVNLNKCVATVTCSSGMTFDPCTNTCTGTATPLKLGVDSLSSNGTSIIQSVNSATLFIPQLNRVGIGSSTVPSTFLQIFGGAGQTLNMSGGRIGGLDLMPLTADEAVPLGYLQANYSSTSSSFWAGSLTGNAWNANTGSIGIGTNNPATKLDVAGDINLNNQALSAANSLNRGYYVYRSGTTSYGLKLQYTGGEYGTMLFGPNQASRFISFGKVGAALEDDDMTEYMRLDLDNGNVGIGTTNPVNLLGLQTTANINQRAINIYSGTTVANGYVSIGSQYATGNSNVNSEIRFGNENLNGAPGYLAFATSQTNSSGLLERLRITSSGNVGIGTTTPNAMLKVVGSGQIVNVSGGRIGGLDLMPLNSDEAVPLGYLQANYSSTSSSLWSGTKNGNIWNGTSGVGNVGIGTNAPRARLEVNANDGVSASIVAANIIEVAGLSEVAQAADVTITAGTLVSGGPTAKNGKGYWDITSFPATITFNTRGWWTYAGMSFTAANVHNYPNGGGNKLPANFLVEASSDGTNWVTVENITGYTSALYYKNDVYGGSGKYIRITATAPQSGETTAKLANVQIFNGQRSGKGPFSLSAEGHAVFIGGNVGIGSTVPTQTLDIQGDMELGVNNFLLKGADTGNPYLDISVGDTASGGTYGRGIILRRGRTGTGATNWANIGLVNDGTLGFGVGNGVGGAATNLMVFNSSGNLGIGTLTPAGKIHLYTNDTGSDDGNELTVLEQAGTGDVGIDFLFPGVRRWRMGIDNSDLDKFKIANAANFSTNTLFTLDNSGNLSIGTSSANTRLHLYDASSGPIISLAGLNTNYRGLAVLNTSNVEQFFYGLNNSNNFVLRSSGSTDLLLASQTTGNIAINATTSLTTKLLINGSVNINGNDSLLTLGYLGTSTAQRVLLLNTDGSVMAGSSFGKAVFMGKTTNVYNGNRGGYTAVNNICAAQYTGSHVCTVEEIMGIINSGNASTIATGTPMWVNNGPPGFTKKANDCDGWSTNASTDTYGRIWAVISNQGTGGLMDCSNSNSFACCK